MNKIRRFIFWLQSSILRKLVALVVFCISIMVLVNIFATTISTQKLLCNFFNDNVDEAVGVVTRINTKELLALSSIVDRLTKSKSNYMARNIDDGDFEKVKPNMQKNTEMNSCHGYVIASSSGEINLTSYSGYTDQQAVAFADFIRYVEDVGGKYNGFVDLLNQGACAVTVHPIGTSSYYLMCKHSFSDYVYLKTSSNFVSLDFNVFDKNGMCIASSLSEGHERCMLGQEIEDKAIIDSVAHTHTSMHSMAMAGGIPYVSAYVPVEDYKGDVISIYKATKEAPVMTKIVITLIVVLFIISIIACVIVAFLAKYYLNRAMVRPLNQIVGASEAVSKGDLTYPIEILKSGDEIELMSSSVVGMQKSLSEMIMSIREMVQLVNVSSRDLSKASINLSDGANKQAASLEEVSAALEEMAASIHQNSDNSITTDRLTQDTNSAIRSIADTSKVSLKDTRKIVGSMHDIENLVRQTNILSLNATVEAARAGDSGRGFAVVAREVGRLADQTKETAVDVNDIAGKSITGAENINKLLEDAQPQIERISILVKEITSASQEQSIGVDQINMSVSELNKLTQENAASAEEVAANSEELSETAKKMRKLVSAFKINIMQ